MVRKLSIDEIAAVSGAVDMSPSAMRSYIHIVANAVAVGGVVAAVVPVFFFDDNDSVSNPSWHNGNKARAVKIILGFLLGCTAGFITSLYSRSSQE